MKRGLSIVGILLALMGIVFFLQGIGLLKGSSMTNESQWVVIGFIIAVVGVGLIYYNNRPAAKS